MPVREMDPYSANHSRIMSVETDWSHPILSEVGEYLFCWFVFRGRRGLFQCTFADFAFEALRDSWRYHYAIKTRYGLLPCSISFFVIGGFQFQRLGIQYDGKFQLHF
jgi:hypothetical protein